MPQLLLSSKTVVEEVAPNISSVPALPTSVTAIAGVTERGPVEAQLTTSKEEWNDVYGTITENAQDVPIFVDGYYDAGGQFLWTKRVLHYTDIADEGTQQGDQSDVTIQTAGSAPTSGSILGSVAGLWDLEPGDTVVVNVDAVGNQTATFSATAASRTAGTTGPYALVDGQNLTVSIDGGGAVSIVFNTASFVSIGAATAAEVAAVIAASLPGASADVNSNAPRITSDRRGTGSGVNVTGGSANAVLNFTTGNVAGTGNVSNINAVTFAEVETIFEAAFTNGSGVTVTQESSRVRIRSNTTGASSSIQVIASSSADDEFGFDNALHSGSAGTPVNTLTVRGKYIGTYADDLVISIEPATSGETDRFNLVVTENGFIRESFPNLRIGTASANDPDYVETRINNASTGSQLIVVEDLLAAAASPANLPDQDDYTMSGGDDGITGLADTDFIGDESTSSGLHGFDVVQGIRILAVPGRATSGVQNAMLNYAENLRNGSMFCVLDPPAGLTAQQMVTYVESTAALLESSEFGAIYWPRVRILNPRKDIFGNSETITVAPSGIICGIYARTDSARDGGIYDPPAGVERGILTGVVGFETDQVLRESVRDLIFPKRINPLTTQEGLPRFIDGPLTLRSTGNFPTVAERRGVIHIEQSLIIGTAFARHSNNDEALRARVERTATDFLTAQMRVGAFRSKDPKKAFLVDVGSGLNTESVVFSGRLIMRIGLATQKPAIFVIMRVSQDTRALEEELAGAA